MCITPFNIIIIDVCSLWIFMELNNFMRSKLGVFFKLLLFNDKVKLSKSVIFVKFEFMCKLMFDSGELCQHISDNILLSLLWSISYITLTSFLNCVLVKIVVSLICWHNSPEYSRICVHVLLWLLLSSYSSLGSIGKQIATKAAE